MKRTSTTNELYFLTLTIIKWIDIFSRLEYKEYLAENIKICQETKGLNLYKYVFMSNHIHMIASVENDQTMSDFLRDFKSFTSKGLFELLKNNQTESRREWMIDLFEKAGRKNPDNKYIQIWQNGSHPVVLDNNEIIDQNAEYIERNPVRAEIVEYPEHYIYSSACEISPIKCLEL